MFIVLILVINMNLAAKSADWIDRAVTKRSCLQLLDSYPRRFRVPLRIVFRNFLIESKERALQSPDFINSGLPVRSVIKFKDETFRVIAILGAGSEGIVYVVETKHGARVIKEFYRKSDIYIEAGKYVDLQAYGVDQRLLYLEFVPGVQTEIISSETHLNEFGMDYGLAIEISEWFANEHESVDFNHVVDIRNGRLVLIDPR